MRALDGDGCIGGRGMFRNEAAANNRPKKPLGLGQWAVVLLVPVGIFLFALYLGGP